MNNHEYNLGVSSEFSALTRLIFIIFAATVPLLLISSTASLHPVIFMPQIFYPLA